MSRWLQMHTVPDLVNKQQRQADRPSFFLPRLVWPSVPHTDSKQLDIAFPQDGQSKLSAVAWFLQELDFSLGITSVLFHNRNLVAPWLPATFSHSCSLCSSLNPVKHIRLVHLNVKIQTDVDNATHRLLLGRTRKTHLITLCIFSSLPTFTNHL